MPAGDSGSRAGIGSSVGRLSGPTRVHGAPGTSPRASLGRRYMVVVTRRAAPSYGVRQSRGAARTDGPGTITAMLRVRSIENPRLVGESSSGHVRDSRQLASVPCGARSVTAAQEEWLDRIRGATPQRTRGCRRGHGACSRSGNRLGPTVMPAGDTASPGALGDPRALANVKRPAVCPGRRGACRGRGRTRRESVQRVPGSALTQTWFSDLNRTAPPKRGSPAGRPEPLRRSAASLNASPGAQPLVTTPWGVDGPSRGRESTPAGPGSRIRGGRRGHIPAAARGSTYAPFGRAIQA